MATYFTRAEAEALLPRVEPMLWELQEWVEEFQQREQEMAALRQKLTGNGHLPPNTGENLQERIDGLRARIVRRLRQIEAIGIEVKDPTTGLIDFPALRNGREVYLCWRLGEGEHIEWWHELDGGFMGRQPLEDE